MLRYILSESFLHEHGAVIEKFDTEVTGPCRPEYIEYYASLMQMVLRVSELEADDKYTPFYPILKIYGRENMNTATKVALERLYSDRDGAPMINLPRNYAVDRDRPPKYNYNCHLLRLSGGEVPTESG